MSRDFNALTMAHHFLREHVNEGAFCIDATAGRGRDSTFLCSLVGGGGKVLAFDVQQDAVDSTNSLLKEQGYDGICRVILDSHSNMSAYADPGSVDCIVFNLGWLPGGDHTVFTHAESTISAVNAGLDLLKPGGVMSICIYYGRDCGFEERDALLAYLTTIDSCLYTVLVTQFCNRPNNPPIPVFIYKEPAVY